MDRNELIEKLSEAGHDGWMDGKKAQNIDSRKSEWGEELMVPYSDLSDKAKDLDRYGVKSVLAAIERLGGEVVIPSAPNHRPA